MIKIYKYKPELQEHAQYFSTEIELIKVLKEDMKDDIETNNTSIMYLVNESYQLGETTELEFTENQAQKTLIDLLNNKKKRKRMHRLHFSWKMLHWPLILIRKKTMCPGCR